MTPRSSRWLLAAAAVASALAVVFAWIQARERFALRAAIAQLAMECNHLQRERESWLRRFAEAEQARGKQKLAQTQSQTTSAASADVPRTPVPPPPRRPWIPERLQNEPQFQLLWLADRRASLATRYGAWYRNAGFAPEKIQQIEAQMIARAEREMDLEALQRAQGMSPDDTVVTRLRSEIARDYDAAMRGLLGDTGWSELREYERGASAREMLAGIAGGAAAVAREPLSGQQAEELFHAIAGASASYRKGGAFVAVDVDWDSVDAVAQRLLTPTQFAFFRSAEPPLPVGGRFQATLYQKVGAATAAERANVAPARLMPDR